RRLEPERLQDRVRRGLQQPDRRTEDRQEPAHRSRDPQGRPLRMAERSTLWHELAEDDVEEAEDRVRDDDGEDRRHPLVELVGEGLLAERTDTQGGERDAELHRGDEATWI